MCSYDELLIWEVYFIFTRYIFVVVFVFIYPSPPIALITLPAWGIGHLGCVARRLINRTHHRFSRGYVLTKNARANSAFSVRAGEINAYESAGADYIWSTLKDKCRLGLGGRPKGSGRKSVATCK